MKRIIALVVLALAVGAVAASVPSYAGKPVNGGSKPCSSTKC
jgi:hypothetical protein